MDKESIRQRLLSERSKLSASEVHKKSRQITDRLLSSELLGNDEIIMSYHAFRNEVETAEINRILLDAHESILLPYTDEKFMIYPCVFDKHTELKPDRFGVMVPKPLHIEDICPQVVILPCVGIDLNGNRIGFGKGCYDRFFSNHSKIRKIALAYDFQVLNEIHSDLNDVPANFIVTETRIIKSR